MKISFALKKLKRIFKILKILFNFGKIELNLPKIYKIDRQFRQKKSKFT